MNMMVWLYTHRALHIFMLKAHACKYLYIIYVAGRNRGILILYRIMYMVYVYIINIRTLIPYTDNSCEKSKEIGMNE